MEQVEIEPLVSELEARVDRLRSLYDMYFMGIERIEPLVPRKDVERRLAILRKEQIRNTGVRFRFQMIIQRYNTYVTYWQRIARQIETGTFKRHVMRATARFGVDPTKEQATGVAPDDDATAGVATRTATAAAAPEETAPPVYELEEMPDDAEDDPFGQLAIVPPKVAPAERFASAQAFELDELAEGSFEEADPFPKPAQKSATAPRVAPRVQVPASAEGARDPERRVLSAPAPRPAIAKRESLPDAPRMDTPTAQNMVRAQGASLPPRVALSTGPAAAAGDPSARRSIGAPAAGAPTPRIVVAAKGASVPAPGASVPAPVVRAVVPGGAPSAPPGPRAPAASISAPGPAPPGPAIAKPVAPVIRTAPPAPRPATASVPSVAPGAPAAAKPATAAIPPLARPATGAVPLSPPAAKPAVAAIPSSPIAKPALSAAPAPSIARPVVTAAPAASVRPVPAPPAAPRPPAPVGDLSGDRFGEIYSKYVETRRQHNEPTHAITRDALAKQLADSTDRLKQKHGSKAIDFEVVVKDGRTILRPVVK